MFSTEHEIFNLPRTGKSFSLVLESNQILKQLTKVSHCPSMFETSSLTRTGQKPHGIQGAPSVGDAVAKQQQGERAA